MPHRMPRSRLVLQALPVRVCACFLLTAVLVGLAPVAQGQEAEPPLPAADGTLLSPLTLQYAATIESARGGMDLTLTHTLTKAVSEEGQPLWRVVNETEAMMGASVDTFEVNRETLLPHRLYSAAAQGTLELRYSRNRVAGRLDAGGQQIRIDEPLEGPIFGYGAALELTIATLDLTPGFDAPLRFFDPQRQAVTTMRLTVEEATTTDVPAGTFETWRLRMAPAAGEGNETVLFARREAPHYIVKSETSLPTGDGTGRAVTVLQAGL